MAVIACTLASACARSHEVPAPGADVARDALQELSAACRDELEDSDDGLPETLECTGLYANVETKALSKSVREYVPAHVLWSDGADKRRWISLPDGETIDAASPDSWVFPVGTRVWKEFSVDDRRVETRLYQKTEKDRWARTTYAWNSRETSAKRSSGADVMVGDRSHHIPSATECDECHSGRKDRLLGFEQALLGLEGATGVTLESLVSDGLLNEFDGATSYSIGAEPDGVAANALGWLHVNCGVTCHNDNPASKGNTRGMRLHLDTTLLDGRDVNEFPSIATTLDQAAATLRWLGRKRIVAGSPEESLLFTLVTQRMEGEQMPPLATQVVDDEHVAVLKEWITRLSR